MLEPRRELISEEEIKQAYEDLEEREEEINKKLEGYLARQFQLEAKLKNMTRVLPKLEQIHSDADHIVEMIQHTALLAEKVSEKVRVLDTTRSRVSECQQRVNELLELQSCSDGAQKALVEEDFEKAAAHVEEFLSKDEYELKKTADDVGEDCTNVYKSFSVLKEITGKLQTEISKKFEEAIKHEDLASVERFFKLYPKINMHNEGLEKYSVYLSIKISQMARTNLNTALEKHKKDNKPNVLFADTLTMLLEGIARMIETHQVIVQTYYGPGRLLTLIQLLQTKCDDESRLILKEFYMARNLESTIKQVNDFMCNKTIEKIEPKNLDILLSELTIMHSKTFLYFKFIKRHIKNDVDGKFGNSEELINDCENFIEKSVLNEKMQIVLDHYLVLERYFMSESINKAIKLNKFIDEGSTTSSMVDDVFFIIRKCIRRACSSLSIHAVCAIIYNSSVCLETEYCYVFKKQLEFGYPSGYLDLTHAYNTLQSIQSGRLQGSDIEKTKLLFITSLNNVDLSLEFVEILCNGLTEEIAKSFPLLSDKEKTKVDDNLSQVSLVRGTFETVREFGIKQLVSSVYNSSSKIKTLVDSFPDYSHKLNEDDVRNYESNDTFMEQLITNLTSFLKSFKEILTNVNYDLLVNKLTSEITKHLEIVILKTQFSRYGGLVLDKEIRALVSYLTSTTSWSVRDKFARLIQIATLLNLEKVSEYSDWEKSGVVWQLSAPEIREILRLRIDFKEDEIRCVKISTLTSKR